MNVINALFQNPFLCGFVSDFGNHLPQGQHLRGQGAEVRVLDEAARVDHQSVAFVGNHGFGESMVQSEINEPTLCRKCVAKVT